MAAMPLFVPISGESRCRLSADFRGDFEMPCTARRRTRCGGCCSHIRLVISASASAIRGRKTMPRNQP